VLIVSRGLTNAGVVQLITRHVIDNGRGLSAHIGIMSSVGAALSAMMNNVAALAVLMPVDMRAAEQAGRAPGLTLMPLAFATLLGGLITLIGTPPNIIIANFRQQTTGEPFAMFDFAPVGLAVAAAGVAFIALVGWRLMPAVGGSGETRQESFALDDYIAEVKVPEEADIIDKRVRELDDVAEKSGVAILGLVRGKKRMPGMARRAVIQAGDTLVVEGAPDDIDSFSGDLGLSYVEREKEKELLKSSDLGFMEVVAPEGAQIIGRSARELRLLTRQGVVLLGVSRQGKRFVEQVRQLAIQPGDVLLLYGPVERLPAVADWLGGLRLAGGAELRPARPEQTGLAAGIFLAAIAIASLELLPLAVALGAVCVAFVATGIVPLRELYEAIEWPVVVLLASLLPIGAALESTGTTALMAEQIVAMSSGASAMVLLGVLMVVTIVLSSVMNNTATAVIAAPLAIDIAGRLNANPDAFLMGVAVAASASFLTPIAHKNNTLIMGPGGYAFGDYWRLGLPLEIIVTSVGLPMILVVWPL